MNKPVRVALIDTYVPDQRFSMYLFARCLLKHAPEGGEVEAVLVSPDQEPCSRRLKAWRKFVVFPWRILRASRRADVVHFCDTSHAIFLNLLSIRNAMVTVHVLGGIRAAAGGGSRLNRAWQALLARGLGRADILVFVSAQSREEAARYVRPKRGQRQLTILNSTYQDFPGLDLPAARALVEAHEPDILLRPFILHLGSNQPRKNRLGVVKTLAALQAHGDYQLVLAGYPPDAALQAAIEERGLVERVRVVPNPAADMVEALYRTAEALVFPSTYEGFGIPVAEAQMCGCPVVCSDIPPHLEILNGTGLTAAPDDAAGMARLVVSLQDAPRRQEIVRAMEESSRTYRLDRMVGDYGGLYQGEVGDGARR